MFHMLPNVNYLDLYVGQIVSTAQIPSATSTYLIRLAM